MGDKARGDEARSDEKECEERENQASGGKKSKRRTRGQRVTQSCPRRPATRHTGASLSPTLPVRMDKQIPGEPRWPRRIVRPVADSAACAQDSDDRNSPVRAHRDCQAQASVAQARQIDDSVAGVAAAGRARAVLAAARSDAQAMFHSTRGRNAYRSESGAAEGRVSSATRAVIDPETLALRLRHSAKSARRREERGELASERRT